MTVLSTELPAGTALFDDSTFDAIVNAKIPGTGSWVCDKILLGPERGNSIWRSADLKSKNPDAKASGLRIFG